MHPTNIWYLRRLSNFLLLLGLVLTSEFAQAQQRPALKNIDRVRLAETFRLADSLSEKVWKDWTKAPFAVLLVTPETEFLLRHPTPSSDFLPLGYDKLLKSNVYYRKRTFDTHLLATFPAVKGSMVSTIVVGQAELTSAKTSTPWVVILLHEHFHQLQNSQPNYYADVEALNLAHGDTSGMWMLNYAFPYNKKEVQDSFRALSAMLVDVLEDKSRYPQRKLKDYLRQRAEFEGLLTADEARYINFQFWQEGAARYTEYRIAQLAGERFHASKQFKALPDYTSFAQTANATYDRILKQLRTQKLEVSRREVVYPFGAAEALLLDRVNPRWRSRYFVDRFDLGKYYRGSSPQVVVTLLRREAVPGGSG